MQPHLLQVLRIGLAIAIVVLAIALVRQWREGTALRAELEIAQTESADLATLQVENRRLREKQIPAAELERLRADRAALPRLRAELEALQKRASTP